jgi:nucleoside-diphosphate-sugar epimerase
LTERLALGSAEVVADDLEYIVSSLEKELEAMSGTRVLLTGGAGFLGYYLTQALARSNEQAGGGAQIRLTVYDNYLRGVPNWLADVAKKPGIELAEHDVTKPLPADAGTFDYVIHAASIGSPTYYRQYPIETMDANVNGLRILLEHARSQQEGGRPVRGFLFLSSSEIYGDPPPEAIPTPETYRGNVSCTGPRACYDESKRFGETLSVTFAHRHALPVVVVRPFNNYGPGLRVGDRRVIPDFAQDILAGKDIVMLSDGSATRTFCYVADAVVGYYKALVRGRPGEAYNIGVEEPEVSVGELARRMADLARELLGYSGRVVQERSHDPDYLRDNPSRRRPDITKARRELQYDPVVSLDDGLRRSLIWYSEKGS